MPCRVEPHLAQMLGWISNRYFGLSRSFRAAVFGQDHDVDAPILRPPLGGEITGDGVILRIARGGQPFWREAMADDQQAD